MKWDNNEQIKRWNEVNCDTELGVFSIVWYSQTDKQVYSIFLNNNHLYDIVGVLEDAKRYVKELIVIKRDELSKYIEENDMINKEKELVAPVFFGESFGMSFGVGVSHSNVIIPDPLDRVCSVYLEMYLALENITIEEYNSKYKDSEGWAIGFYEWLIKKMSGDAKKLERLLFDLHENGLQ